MPSTAHQAVIFDCDGTLIDSEQLGLQALREEAARLGFVFEDAQDLQALKGQAMSRNIRHIERQLGRPLPHDFEATVRRRMAAAFRAQLQAMPGAHDTLQALDAMGLPYCVASNGPRDKMDLTLALTGLLPLVAGRVFSAYEVGHFKPEPGLFLHAARAMGVRPENCAVIEDSASGIEAGLSAGMTVYVVGPLEEIPREFAPRVQVLARLTDLLQRLLERSSPRAVR